MSHVPLSTMSRLSSLKLADIEPAELRVAARLPDALQPRPDGVTVHIDVAGQKHGKTAKAELILEPAVEPSELAPLSLHHRAGYQVWVYRLSPNDVDRLKRLIEEAGGPPASRSRQTSRRAIASHTDRLHCQRRPFCEPTERSSLFSLRISICAVSSPNKIWRHACPLVREGMQRLR